MTMLPPTQFDHPYSGPVVEMTMTAEQVTKACRNPYAEACILFPPNFPGDKCFVVLPLIGPGGTVARQWEVLRRHEIGHCNGWGKDHAGAR